jgi:hypothetical protein|tara:strand:- start:389 stop:1321 length:933 start_codon:yes stop_codon:yes gene_type:complete
MTEIVSINTDNYAAMAKAMGIAGEGTGSSKKANSLNRLRIWHSPLMGQAEVNGKMTNVEVVQGGTYRLEIVEGDSSKYYYSKEMVVRPFMQRFMYRRYVANMNAKQGEPKGTYHRTIMADTLNIDLKDNTGKFNCGKPTGYIQDFKALPSDMQDLIRQIKRVRVVFGTVEMIKPMDQDGKEAELKEVPFIWEIDNKDAYKTVGDQFTVFSKKERLPLQHKISFAETKENPLPNGSSFYTPTATVDLLKTYDIDSADQTLFSDFMDWVKNYNDYIYKEWDEKAYALQKVSSDDDIDTVNQFIDVELDQGVA